MTRILVFGDSNSWGTPPDGSGVRFDAATRWPQVMAKALGWELAEENLPGRTTRHDDDRMLGAAMNGLAHLPVALKSQSPVDWLVIMLGTNDLKARFEQDAAGIAAGLMALVDCARRIGGGQAGWEDDTPPKIAIVVPPALGTPADDPKWPRLEEWAGGYAKSLDLGDAIRHQAKMREVPVFDAGFVVKSSDIDPIHIDAESHRALGLAVAEWLQTL